jgi:anti-sigma regulatory factor (Ser/Thr protein kinase)
MPARLRRTIPADLDSLRRVNVELAAFLGQLGVPEKTVHDAQLVCEELIANAVRHGLRDRDPATAEIVLEIDVGGEVAITIRDDLPPFDPTHVPPRPRARSLQDEQPGSHGLALVRRATSSFRWREERGGNLVELRVPIRASTASEK